MTIPIYVEEPITWEKIQVPYEVVEYCKKFTRLDPYNVESSIEDLRLTDCYWMNMGYYDINPVFE
jgi:DNA-directed RNA polymerase subunit F